MDAYDQDILKRIYAKRRITPSRCWEYSGQPSRRAAQVSYAGSMELVHRLVFRLLYPDKYKHNLQVNHTCDNGKCFNPEHLYSGTQSENVYDMYNRDRHTLPSKTITHCIQGHEFTLESTYTDLQGMRHCKICRRENSKEYYERNK